MRISRQPKLKPLTGRIGFRRNCAAFTMIEIAIALAIIGFALVAIVGVLPAGLNVQKENREETILNQDGPFLLEAIRSGAQGFDDLTNYVQSISIVSETSGPPGSNYYAFNRGATGGFPFNGFTNGARIISLLSTPKYAGVVPKFTNRVTAVVKAFSGSVTEKAGSDLAFSYQLTAEVVPYTFIPSSDIANPAITNGGVVVSPEDLARVERGFVGLEMAANLYEIRLLFQWPLLPDGRPGTSRQTYRTLIASFQTNEAFGVVFKPQTFRRTLLP